MSGDTVWCKARVYSSFLYYFLGFTFYSISSIYVIYLLLSVLLSFLSTFPLSFILYSSIISPIFFFLNFLSFFRTFFIFFFHLCFSFFPFTSPLVWLISVFLCPFSFLSFSISFAHYPFFPSSLPSFFPNFCFFCAVQMYVTKLLSVKQYFVIGCELV